MNLLTPILLLAVLGLLYWFYDAFTKRGAIPIKKALRDFTSWFSAALIALADWFVLLGQWLAELWQPFQEQFGTLLAADSMSTVVQAIGFLFLALKLKAQKPLPAIDLPKPGAQ
ncbi:MAG TPA: hypothetical protein PKZ27_03190 [Rhodocyclaceae bacterium]|nr:hypothetical protein [Rhodocyclaceae bacterium]